MDSLVGGNRDLVAPFHRAHLGNAIIGGEVWVAGVNEGGINAVAMWFPPGRSSFERWESRTGIKYVLAEIVL
jgi:hypothetical protein